MFSLAFLHVWFGCFVCKSRPRLRKAVCLQCVQHTLCTHQLQRQAFCTCDDNMDPAKKSKAGRKKKVKRGSQKCDSVDQKLSKPERKRNLLKSAKPWPDGKTPHATPSMTCSSTSKDLTSRMKFWSKVTARMMNLLTRPMKTKGTRQMLFLWAQSCGD